MSIFTDAVAVALAPGSSQLRWSTYLGGSNNDQARDLALGLSGDLHLAGRTASADFPTADPYQAAFPGGGDCAIAAIFHFITPTPTVTPTMTPTPSPTPSVTPPPSSTPTATPSIPPTATPTVTPFGYKTPSPTATGPQPPPPSAALP